MIRSLALVAAILLLIPRTGAAAPKLDGAGKQPAVRPAVYVTPADVVAAPQPGTEVVLAEAPGIKPNLPRPHYILARRRGEKLTSLFAAVIEPSPGGFAVESLAPIPLEGPPGEMAAAAFRILSRGGVEDIVYSSGDDLPRSGGGFTFAGRFVHARFSNGSLEALRLVGAKTFEGRGWAIRRPASGWEGRVESVDPGSGRVATSTPLPADGSLSGALVSFARGAGGRTSSYRIARVTAAGAAATLELDETILLGRGIVEEVREGRTILSPVPHEFGRGVSRGDSGFFHGATLRSASGATAVVRAMKPSKGLEIETDDASSFRKGEAFVYEDITPGGGFRIEALMALERSSTGVYALKGAARPEVVVPPGTNVRVADR